MSIWNWVAWDSGRGRKERQFVPQFRSRDRTHPLGYGRGHGEKTGTGCAARARLHLCRRSSCTSADSAGPGAL